MLKQPLQPRGGTRSEIPVGRRSPWEEVPDLRRWRINWDRVQAVAIWLLGSLLAIAVIGDQPHLGLALAVLSGIALGLANLLADDGARSSRSGESEPRPQNPD